MIDPRALRDSFDDSYRLTRLLSGYLTAAPDAIKPSMMEAMCEEGVPDKAEAFAYLLSALFEMDMEDKEARRFFRHYLRPSIRQLDPAVYEADAYFQAISFPETSIGAWDFKTVHYPAYRAFVCDDPLLREDYSEIQRIGFFDRPYSFPAVLEGGNEWMTLTPVDMDTCQSAIAGAHGKVATFGLGLGYFAFHVLNKPEVTSLTVVEHARDVISLFEAHLLAQLPHREKLTIIQGDAFDYMEHVMPGEKFDTCFIDTWRDAGDGLDHYLRYKPLEKYSPGTAFSYWIEDTLLSRFRAMTMEENFTLFSLGRMSFDALIASLERDSLRRRASET